jgi:hypothetical protein
VRFRGDLGAEKILARCVGTNVNITFEEEFSAKSSLALRIVDSVRATRVNVGLAPPVACHRAEPDYACQVLHDHDGVDLVRLVLPRRFEHEYSTAQVSNLRLRYP